MIPELGDDVDAATKQRLRNNPPLWVRNALRHPLDPSRSYDFKTEDGEPLTHLLDDESWLHPDEWADINVLLLARGELKSTSTGWLATWAHDAFPQLHTYYIAPSNDQVIDYVEPIRQTYVEQASMGSRRVTDNKKNQVFKTYQRDDTGDVNPVLGRFQTDSGYSEKSVRGKHSQLGITDETQDLSERVFNVFLPAIDMGLPDNDFFPTVFCIGTPKETGSFYHDLWERSDQRTWDAASNSWVKQSSVDPYTISADDVAELPGNVELDGDEEEYTVHAWHVDWINSPLHSMADVARAKEMMGEMEFANEVLAQFYDPEDNLLAQSTIKACFDSSYNYRESPHNSDNTTVVVADWGGGSDKNASDTIFMAAEQITYEDDSHEYVLLNIAFLDPDKRNREQIRTFERWLTQYDADVGLVDYGFGEQAMESLQHGDDTVDADGYMDMVSAVHYGNVKDKTDVKWVEDDNGNQLFFTCDKSRNATRMVESIRDNEWVIPRATNDSTGVTTATSDDDGVRLLEQATAPYKTLAETKTGQKRVDIETPGNQRDDSFDALTFVWLAFNEVADTDDAITDFAINSRPGVSGV
jgi:hypothetical protein